MKAKRAMCAVSIVDKQDRYEVTDRLRQLISRAANETVQYEKVPYFTSVNVTLCTDRRIHALNLRFRGIDRSTDVLSFPLLEEGALGPDELDRSTGRLPLGDIVISLPHAYAQAEQYGHSFERETAFLTVHSMLHLLGYDHETGEEDEKDMFDRQEKILARMGLTR